MKNFHIIIAIVALIFTIFGIILMGNVSPFVAGSIFVVAAIAYYLSAYLAIKKRKMK